LRYFSGGRKGCAFRKVFKLALANEMIAAGLVAHPSCIDPGKLDRSFAGRRLASAFRQDLPSEIIPCGENGEFHTVVSAGPMYRNPIEVSVD
jgi:diphthamide synthase (EF-2-diphthine--ammonia ligase)